MLHMFSVGFKTLIFLAVLSLCFVAGILSSLDESTRLSSRLRHLHIPQIPFSRPVEGEWSLPTSAEDIPSSTEEDYGPEPTEHHWIDDLIAGGAREHNELLSKQTHGVHDAAIAYKRRRGRQPPPRFGQWVKFAEDHNAIIVEDFFDQIYHDLDPFWAIEPRDIRNAGRAWKVFISVRDGNATYRTDEEGRPWPPLWTDMIQQIAEFLPDMDIAINEMDESRIMVPHEDIARYLAISKTNREKFPEKAEDQVTDYPSRYNNTFAPDLFPNFGFRSSDPIWSFVKRACPPDSPARQDRWSDMDLHAPPEFPDGAPVGTYHGFVANWTDTKDPCVHPHLRGLHGSFIEPVSISTTDKLIPMFGGSKLPMNNDILLPAAMYWTENEFYKGSEKRIPWTSKKDGVIWRGAATGGRNKEWSWKRFQRHRFVSMLNGTQVHALEVMEAAKTMEGAKVTEMTGQSPESTIDTEHVKDKTAYNFRLPLQDIYNLSVTLDGRLGSWTDTFADGKIGNLLCFPPEKRGGACSYTDPFYQPRASHTPMEKQYEYKYLPDIDGNSFSGRYRGFLRSFSLPIKATIYAEWHDSRLVPWKHFVPMDNTFVDWYAIMEYFLGYEPVGEMESEDGVTKSKDAVSHSKDAVSNLKDLISDFQDGRTSNGVDETLRRYYSHHSSSSSKGDIRPPRREPHDLAARRIAEAGHEWAEQVLRKEDMLVYVYRLLLEYARLASDHRERMGWVGEGSPIEGHSLGNIGGLNEEVRAGLDDGGGGGGERGEGGSGDRET